MGVWNQLSNGGPDNELRVHCTYVCTYVWIQLTCLAVLQYPDGVTTLLLGQQLLPKEAVCLYDICMYSHTQVTFRVVYIVELRTCDI